MKKMTLFVSMMILISVNMAWAQDTASSGSVTGSQSTMGPNLGDERVGIRPQLGYMAYQDPIVGSTTKGMTGIGLEFNVSKSLSPDVYPLHMAISTGILYSHLGSAGSNFFGNDSSSGVGASSDYMLAIPVNAKIGYNIADSVRISAHGGGNVIYRSAADLVDLGTPFNTGSAWDLFPNAGADLDIGLGKNVSFLVRPDWTFTDSSPIFMGTVGVDFALN